MLGKQQLARRLKLDEARAALQDVGQNPHWHWSMGWVEGRYREVFLSACGLLLPLRFHASSPSQSVSIFRDLCPDCYAIETRDELHNSGDETVPSP